MGTILVVGEQANGHLKKATLSALTAAQQVAQNTGGNIAGVVIGAGAGQAAQELAGYGIPVHVVEGAAFEHALAETHSAAAAEVAKKASADEVVIAATAYGKDIAPRIAAKLGANGDFKRTEQLGEVLNAAVRASRAVVDAGWQSNDLQVGQTRCLAAPQL